MCESLALEGGMCWATRTGADCVDEHKTVTMVLGGASESSVQTENATK